MLSQVVCRTSFDEDGKYCMVFVVTLLLVKKEGRKKGTAIEGRKGRDGSKREGRKEKAFIPSLFADCT